jgi:hypothetical protein
MSACGGAVVGTIDPSRARDVEVLGVSRIHDHLLIDELAVTIRRKCGTVGRGAVELPESSEGCPAGSRSR